jgi:hypothetical protein
MKKIKVMIEIPSGWLDADLTRNLDWITRTVKEEVERQLVQKVANEVKTPEIKINKKKLEDLILKELAKRRVDREERRVNW